MVCLFFFFKQKTAYEMRISDWSSDVCSSDLRVFSPRGENAEWDFRDQPPEFWDQFKTDFAPGTHIRVHPLLHWTELDIWLYIQREGIPLMPLYFARNGKRYRSLGDMDITNPISSDPDQIEKIIDERTEEHKSTRLNSS